MRVDKPWGYEEWLFVGENYAFKKLFMTAGNACSLQFHVQKHETVYVVSGELQFEVGATAEDLVAHRLVAGDSWVIEQGTVHRMSAVMDTVYLEASTPQLDDVVRITDKYGRV